MYKKISAERNNLQFVFLTVICLRFLFFCFHSAPAKEKAKAKEKEKASVKENNITSHDSRHP